MRLGIFLTFCQSKCVLSPPYGYAVDARYGATCFARRSANGLPLSVCLTAKAVRAKGKAPSRNRNTPTS